MGSKWKDALGVVQINSAIAGTLAAALAPIPFADVVPLQLNNVAMLMGICSVYQVKVEKAAALNIVATTAASFGGQALFSAVAGMIPGVGSVANATVAVGVTEAIGAAIVGFCELALKNGEKPDFSKFKGDDFKHYTDCLKYLDQRDKNN